MTYETGDANSWPTFRNVQLLANCYLKLLLLSALTLASN